ncbi:uncharacterized protein LOC132919452 isoform X1 [Rhopalosiphum padi]|uniref:uncharacterized protein LOC132919452 isoform X1 n=1 Tax=Rhopalosiphum padi TaxID=40932 RepID=UPI00298E64E3|nr:uncharacterized protein LOC132919452 isoform X1 [Rhopalosiphum padi]
MNRCLFRKQGFCCSCLDSVNAARQQRSSEVVSKINISITTNNDVVIQPRGEQDCKNITNNSPSYANSYTYHESAHCFRYSDLWFNVYKVEKSETVLPLTLELFKKSESSVYSLQQQCFSSLSSNSNQTIFKNLVSYRYEVKGLNETVENDLMAMFILIPQNVPKTYQYGLPYLNDQPAGKYLAIHPSKMSKNGGVECDKIGVEPRGFYEQPDRCYRPRGTCLGEQPIQLLLQREADCSVEPSAGAANGRLFIEDYVKGDISFDDVHDHIIVDRQPVSTDAEIPVSVQSVGEVRLDYNAVINDKILLQISEVHAILDNDCNNTAKLLVFVTNLGLKTADFFIDTSGPRDSKKIRKIREQAIIHPQQTEKIFLAFECHTSECVATVRLYTEHAADVAVASRKCKVVRGSGCYCLWHRRCKCYQAESPCAAGGRSLSQAQYTGAGFLGDVPPRTAIAEEAVHDRNTLVASLIFLIGYLAAALVLGLLKAVSPYRSHWLWTVDLGKRHLDAYKEPELRTCPVVRDDHGYCVHPITKSRHIRLLDRGQEFVTNALFFVSLPTAMVYEAHCNLTGDCCFVAQDHSSCCIALSAHRQSRDDFDLPLQTNSCDFLQAHGSNTSESIE